MRKLSGQGLAAVAVAVVLAGCSDAAGVSDTAGDIPTAQATVVLQTGAAQPVVEAVLASLSSPDGPLGNGDMGARITPDQVESLMLVVEHVEVLPTEQLQEKLQEQHRRRGANRGFHGFQSHDDWYVLDVVPNGEIDLMDLPTEDADGLVLATGEIPAGEYSHARLFVSKATIQFKVKIERPSGVVFEQGEPYEVYIPSADESGIKTHAGFTIAAEATEVVLVFDADATLRHVVVTGDGAIIVPPVIGSYGRSGT